VSRPKREEDQKDALDVAADEGTLIHATLEALAEQPVNKWNQLIEENHGLPTDLKYVTKDAGVQVADIFSLGLPVVTKNKLGLRPDDHYEIEDILWENGKPVYAPPAGRPSMREIRDAIYCEVGLSSNVCLPGTADVLAIMGSHGWLIDYKTNRVIRSHSEQQLAYDVAAFLSVPRLETLEQRIVAPRLGDVHRPVEFTRAQLPEMQAELQAIVDRADDPFTPGHPGDQCAFCAGNGRCPWQMASLREIVEPEGEVTAPNMWKQLLDPNISDEMRGKRRGMRKEMDRLSEAIKNDDEAWARAHPGVNPWGWTVSLAKGKLTLDMTRLAEINDCLRLTFGLSYEKMDAFMKPDLPKLAEYLGMATGISTEVSAQRIASALAGFMRRGADTVRMTQAKAEKPKVAALKDKPALQW
jgi:hypothetical protein